MEKTLEYNKQCDALKGGVSHNLQVVSRDRIDQLTNSKLCFLVRSSAACFKILVGHFTESYTRPDPTAAIIHAANTEELGFKLCIL